jgi:AcrR family transcriptional regulator
MLAEDGYARLTMDRVAARAGVGKASLYRRWPTKDELIADALAHQVEQSQPEAPDTGSLHRDMLGYLRALIRFRQTQMAGLHAVAGEVLTNPALAALLRRQVAGSIMDTLRAIVQRAVDRGELPPTTDTDLVAMLAPALLFQLRLRGEPIDERQAKRIADQFFTPASVRRPAGQASAAGGEQR